MDPEPPFQATYKNIFDNPQGTILNKNMHHQDDQDVGDHDQDQSAVIEVVSKMDCCDLPLIDLMNLNKEVDEELRMRCKKDIVEASKEWGFFQIKNHGIPRELLERVAREEETIFRQPFERKVKQEWVKKSKDCYRWGAPAAYSLNQFSWSEAFHIPLAALEDIEFEGLSNFRSTYEEFAAAAWELALRLAAVLTENLGCNKQDYFVEKYCSSGTSYIRLNRYPPCPILSPNRGVYGLMPHTDSDFLTILYQDHVGGLQLFKDQAWITVNPNPDSLVVNIGDLFQAWSNGEYKSIKHRVMANPSVERFSIAYFMCPSYDTEVESYIQPSIYKKFSFREYRQQVQMDVKSKGYKVGLSRFLV